jgi:hypothetical protein
VTSRERAAGTSTLTDAPEKAQAAIKCKLTGYHPTDNSWSCASGVAGWYHACDYHVDGHRVRAHIDAVEPGPGPDRLSQRATRARSLREDGGRRGPRFI